MGNGRRSGTRLLCALAFVSSAACGGGSGPTAPAIASPTPAAPAPGFSLAGIWTGTISYSAPALSTDPALAQLRQDGAAVDATIRAPRFNGRFQGTLAGDRLSGSLTTMIDNVPFGATASGTASPAAIHLVSRALRFQNQTTSAATIDLAR